MDMPERITKLETQVESLKEDVGELKSDVKELHSRITTGNREIIEKIDLMETRVQSHIRDNSEASVMQHQRIENEMKKDIQTIADKVNILERWRFMIVGAAVTLGYLLSHLEIFSKLFNFR